MLLLLENSWGEGPNSPGVFRSPCARCSKGGGGVVVGCPHGAWYLRGGSRTSGGFFVALQWCPSVTVGVVFFGYAQVSPLLGGGEGVLCALSDGWSLLCTSGKWGVVMDSGSGRMKLMSRSFLVWSMG